MKEYMEKTIRRFAGKRILVWGYGREGRSTEKLLKEYCSPEVVDIYEGSREGVEEDLYDYVFVSPGIKFEEDAPDFRNEKFTSQTEIFMEEYGAQTVGITGTKGKSTTSAMLAAVLSACTDRKVFLMGNIGKPCFDYMPEMDENSIAVFELSCHQCQRLQKDPHTAVFLNLYEDHLDRYITRKHYFEAKLGITRRQAWDDILYYGEDVPAFETKAKKRLVTRKEVRGFTLKIPGDHNQLNAEFVYRIAKEVYGCDGTKIREALSAYSGLPHRLEYAGTVNGVMYYDDSISTIPEAAISAAESVKNVKTLLVGGMDRGIDYDILISYIRKRRDITFLLAYASGARIYEAVKDLPNVQYVEDLKAQVETAAKITPSGGAVVMSNAAASYGYFKNFEERGDFFKSLISEIRKNTEDR